MVEGEGEGRVSRSIRLQPLVCRRVTVSFGEQRGLQGEDRRWDGEGSLKDEEHAHLGVGGSSACSEGENDGKEQYLIVGNVIPIDDCWFLDLDFFKKKVSRGVPYLYFYIYNETHEYNIYSVRGL